MKNRLSMSDQQRSVLDGFEKIRREIAFHERQANKGNAYAANYAEGLEDAAAEMFALWLHGNTTPATEIVDKANQQLLFEFDANKAPAEYQKAQGYFGAMEIMIEWQVNS